MLINNYYNPKISKMINKSRIVAIGFLDITFESSFFVPAYFISWACPISISPGMCNSAFKTGPELAANLKKNAVFFRYLNLQKCKSFPPFLKNFFLMKKLMD